MRTMLIATFALLAAITTAALDGELFKRAEKLECDECDHFYVTCMNACMKAHPTLPGRHAECNAACFCEVAKVHECGEKCGFDIQPCNKKREEISDSEVDFEEVAAAAVADEVFAVYAGKIVCDEPFHPATAIEERQDAQMECDECDHMYITCMTACMRAHPTLTRLHAQCNAACFCEMAKVHDCGTRCGFDEGCPNKRKELPANESTSAMPQTISVTTLPSTLQTMAAPTSKLVGRQVFSQCAGCGNHIRICMNSHCPDNDLAGAISCVCDQPMLTCVKDCHAGECARRTEINFKNYCPSVKPIGPIASVKPVGPAAVVSYQPASSAVAISSVPALQKKQVDPYCTKCGWLMDACIDMYCPAGNIQPVLSCFCTTGQVGCKPHCHESVFGCYKKVEAELPVKCPQAALAKKQEIPVEPPTPRDLCGERIGNCMLKHCPTRDREGAIKCACEGPDAACAILGDNCRPQLQLAFLWYCPKEDTSRLEKKQLIPSMPAPPTCGDKIGNCMRSACATQDREGAAKCACEGPDADCMTLGADCRPQIELAFDWYCKTPASAATERKDKLVKKQGPVYSEECGDKIGSCFREHCPSEDKEATIQCVCEDPEGKCASLDQCRARMAIDFDAFCPKFVPSLTELPVGATPPPIARI